jgi:SAM-dependent methyltransferase
MSWVCPVCAGAAGSARWGAARHASADDLRPSASQFGATLARTIECGECRHISLETAPEEEVLAESYGDASDPVSIREEAGQVETARRTLNAVEQFVQPGKLADLGCWTGSLLVAARERGWDVAGVEPSKWASGRARARGLEVHTRAWNQHDLPYGEFRLVTMCDVLEHLVAPGEALDEIKRLLEPNGVLLLTLPDAGSPLARMLGRRWWSVLPMHVQYFTRSSLRRLLESHGYEVRLMRTHPKRFSARYYAERLRGYSSLLERIAVFGLDRVGLSDRLVAPDFRDRLLVIAAAVSR